jgi:hypothetical protein
VNGATWAKMEMGRSASALSVELPGINRVTLASQHVPYRHCYPCSGTTFPGANGISYHPKTR